MDLFLITVIIITILFWIDLFLPDPIPFIDEFILFIMMVGGWALYGFYKVTSEGFKTLALIFSPVGIMVIVIIFIGWAIWKFNLLGNPTPRRKRR